MLKHIGLDIWNSKILEKDLMDAYKPKFPEPQMQYLKFVLKGGLNKILKHLNKIQNAIFKSLITLPSAIVIWSFLRWNTSLNFFNCALII